MSNEILDVAIIGAGASGTYTAWRLANDKNQDPAKVTLFDFLKIDNKAHVGGRLWSTHLPGLGHTRKAEIGGMRFLTSQTIVTNIIPELGFTSVPFDVDSIDNLFNLRSKVLRTSEITDPDKIPYNLAPLERGMSPGGLLLYAVETLVPNAPYLTSEEWLDVKMNFKVNGCHLYELGFWNLLEMILSEEGYEYVYSGQGYNTIPSNWNAADAMEWILEDFAADVSYRYLKEGYQELPKKLLAQAMKKGVKFQEHSKLRKWAKRDDGIIELTFESTDKKGGEFKVYTKKLVIAAPKKSLELIEMPKTKDMDIFYNQLLPSVEPQPMFKFFLGYKYPWWRTLGMSSGRTITDNPLRQIYYWGSNYQKFFSEAPEKTEGIPNDPENSVLMIYLDGRDVSYWQPLFELMNIHSSMLNLHSENDFDVLKVHSKDLNSFLVDIKEELSVELKELKSTNETPEEAIKELVKRSKVVERKLHSVERNQAALDNLLHTISVLLMRAHGINFIPEPYTFAYADWTANPFGGAYNLWKSGYKSWEVTKDIIKPVKNTEVYIVGEAYSVKQGWVEGALETAEQMLQTYFELEEPVWLGKSYKIE
tara:strand:+ start:1524 stop:3299 length:1776 start_codon:yes stop_codon:yes gene_type:complete